MRGLANLLALLVAGESEADRAERARVDRLAVDMAKLVEKIKPILEGVDADTAVATLMSLVVEQQDRNVRLGVPAWGLVGALTDTLAGEYGTRPIALLGNVIVRMMRRENIVELKIVDPTATPEQLANVKLHKSSYNANSERIDIETKGNA